jgi:hypothetical protein
MRPILIALLTALYFVPVHAAEQMEAPKDMVVLTVSGDIRNINRGALDSGRTVCLPCKKSTFSAPLPSTVPCCFASSRGRSGRNPGT